MKAIIAASLFILLFIFSLPGPANAAVDVGFSLDFHDALSPYGTWVHVSSCPDCWRPSAPGFVPFTMGHWVYTSYGPMWVGEEPWAWAPYHYGHWIFTAQYGWIWEPGYDWSPGNVTWMYGDDYIGWSPAYGAGMVDTNLWVVVHRDHFFDRDYAPVRVQRDTVRTLFERRAVRVASAPLERAQAERIVRHPIQVQTVHEREIEVNHHRTRLVVTPDREETVVKHIAEVSAKHGQNGHAANPQDAREAGQAPGGKESGKAIKESSDSKHNDAKKESAKKKHKKPPEDQSPNQDY